jgi:hypothetical protein
VASRLEQLLAGSGVVVMHDRRLPGSRANIDHLALGPGGVTVIDTKRLRGRVEVRGDGDRAELRVGGRDRSILLDAVKRQLAVVASVAPGVDIRAALCFVDPSGLPLLRVLRPRGVLVDSTRGVAKLTRRPGPLDVAEIAELAGRLGRAFPDAGD